MNRIEGSYLSGKIRRGRPVRALFPLCFAMVGMSAQTPTTFYSFDGADGALVLSARGPHRADETVCPTLARSLGYKRPGVQPNVTLNAAINALTLA
jgi:hypothetical protein